MLSNALRPTEPHAKALRVNLDPVLDGAVAELEPGRKWRTGSTA